MLREQEPGSVVVLSGRYGAKIERIEQSVAHGFHVLVDKPWIHRSAVLPRIAATLDLADEKGLIAYDIMTDASKSPPSFTASSSTHPPSSAASSPARQTNP